MKEKFNKNNLYIANLRYYEDPYGVEFGSDLSKIILYKHEDTYYNVFNIFESYPVFENSTAYGEYDSDGNQYGTKKIYKGGWLQTGPCWVIDYKMFDEDDNKDISISQLEDIVLGDDSYFKDRMDIANRRYAKNPLKLVKVILRDRKNEDNMRAFFESRLYKEKTKI